MAKKKRFLFLSEEFYLAYPSEDYTGMNKTLVAKGNSFNNFNVII